MEHTKFSETFTIRSYHTDLHRILTIPKLCSFFQDIAGNHTVACGKGWEVMQQQNVFWVLSRLKIEVIDYPKWRDKVKINTWSMGSNGLFAYRNFIVEGEDEKPLVKAVSMWLMVNTETRRVVRPDEYMNGFPAAWMHYCMGPGHFVMAAKLPGKFTRLLMSQPADKADAAATPHHVFGGILAQHFDGIRFGETDWHSRWGSVVRLAHSYRRGAVFLAGDAAHTHSTAGGQGMNCCMQDAWNLGWKLGYVLRGAAPESVLESYERERKPIGSQVIGAASAIHELFMAGRNSGPEGLRALRDSGFLDELLGKVSGLSYHYRAEGAAAGALPAAGDRMPNVALPAGAGGQWVLDLLRHTKFTLLAVAPDSIDAAAEKWLADSAQKRRGCVEGRVLPHAPRVLAAADGGTYCYLVRPDGYVAASAPAHETGALERALGEWLS